MHSLSAMRSLSARSFAVRSCPVVVRPAWIRPEARRSNAPSGGRCLSNGPSLAGHGIVSGGDVSPGPGQRPEAAALSRAGALASEVFSDPTYYSAHSRFADQRLWAIEVKRSLSLQLGRGFHQARVDLPPKQTFVVIPGDGGYPLADGLEVLALAQLAERIHGQRCAGGGELGPRAALTPRW